jgi:hypothetical protein
MNKKAIEILAILIVFIVISTHADDPYCTEFKSDEHRKAIFKIIKSIYETL